MAAAGMQNETPPRTTDGVPVGAGPWAIRRFMRRLKRGPVQSPPDPR